MLTCVTILDQIYQNSRLYNLKYTVINATHAKFRTNSNYNELKIQGAQKSKSLPNDQKNRITS